MNQAIERYVEIGKRFQTAEQNARKFDIDETAFEQIISDIDAVIHQLEGTNAFGYAYMFKAYSLYYLYFRKLGRMKLRPVQEMDKITAPMINEIRWNANKAKEILSQFESAESNIGALNDLMAKLE